MVVWFAVDAKSGGVTVRGDKVAGDREEVAGDREEVAEVGELTEDDVATICEVNGSVDVVAIIMPTSVEGATPACTINQGNRVQCVGYSKIMKLVCLHTLLLYFSFTPVFITLNNINRCELCIYRMHLNMSEVALQYCNHAFITAEPTT